MTPQQIVDEANALARQFYAEHGCRVREGYRFDLSAHPQERLMWRLAGLAFERLRDTDVEDALSEAEDA